MTADYPMGTLYVELHYSAPPDLAPEYNGGRGRKVELFRDPPGVVAVVPQAATVEEARDAARALLARGFDRSEEHTSELQSREHLVCPPLLENKEILFT